MKPFFNIYSLCTLLLMLLFSCTREDVNVAALTQFSPSVVSVNPNGQVRVGTDFDITVVLADGSNSPLSSASLSLTDASGSSLASTNVTFSSTTMDSVSIPGSDFNAATLDTGAYTISLIAVDTDGQRTERDFPLLVSTQLFAANHAEMFIAGEFNGWGFDVMNLVGNNTWEIKNVNLMGGGWKFKNCEDWCDEDWGDADCNGKMESNYGPGGNGNTECGSNGPVNVRFNDQTLTYSVVPAVTFAQNVSGLFLLGSFNEFFGNEYQFNLLDDNTWILDEVQLAPGDNFRFAEMPDFMGQNFGDPDGDGIAEAFAGNATFPDSLDEAFYSVTFNDATLAYSFEFLRFPSLGIIGSATPTGWDSDTDLTDNGDGTFSIDNFELTDGEVKFRANDGWDQNWGGEEFPSGSAIFNGPNIIVTAGVYDITFDRNNLTYRFEEDMGFTNIGIIGDATPGGWDADTDMTRNDDGTFSIIIGLIDGAAKFRADDDWAVNWGTTDFPSGTGTQDGDNIPVSAGIYEVTFNPETGDYSFTPLSIGIIGSATPTGWDSDTDMAATGTAGEVSIAITLIDGEVKFRANDDWPINWGGTDFPSGAAIFNGGNIPTTAGDYTVKLNVNTLTYSFE